MGILEDVIKALERIPAWKRLNALPAEVERLSARVQALEKQLALPPGETCRRCQQRTLRLIETTPASGDWAGTGLLEDLYRCSSCDYEDRRQRDPMR
jgi:hypothetical protein